MPWGAVLGETLPEESSEGHSTTEQCGVLVPPGSCCCWGQMSCSCTSVELGDRGRVLPTVPPTPGPTSGSCSRSVSITSGSSIFNGLRQPSCHAGRGGRGRPPSCIVPASKCHPRGHQEPVHRLLPPSRAREDRHSPPGTTAEGRRTQGHPDAGSPRPAAAGSPLQSLPVPAPAGVPGAAPAAVQGRAAARSIQPARRGTALLRAGPAGSRSERFIMRPQPPTITC